MRWVVGGVVLLAALLAPSPVVAVPDADDVPLSGVVQVAVADLHACAATADGGALCWGDNSVGQLGDGTTTDATRPVAVVDGLGQPITGVEQVSTGYGFSCARFSDGTAECWGSDLYGDLGNGFGPSQPNPTPVVGVGNVGVLSEVVAITSGFHHTCVLLENAELRCWGRGDEGQLGDGSLTTSHTPVVVGGPMDGVAQVDAGYEHTCAAMLDGQARCWGEMIRGQLGVPVGNGGWWRSRPAVVRGHAGLGPLRDVASIAAGLRSSCAVLRNGQARCWGRASFGRLGGVQRTGLVPFPNTVVAGPSRRPVTGLASISVAGAACAVRSNGGVFCWGPSGTGVLGQGDREPRLFRVPVRGADGVGLLTGVTQVDVGGLATCAVLESTELRCWGRNAGGLLGDGTTTDRYLPGAVVAPLP